MSEANAPAPGRRVRPGRLLRALFVCAVLAWVLPVSGLLPATPAGLAQAGALAGVAFVLLVVSGYLRSDGRRPALVAGLDFLLFQCALALVGVDVALRWIAEWRPSTLLLPKLASASAQIEAYHELPGAVRFWFPCNSLGFYDDEPPEADDPRPWIACIGDSLVAGAVPHPLNFATVAEGLTGRTIQCFGVSAAGPREYLDVLERDVLPRGPESILLTLFVGNDVGDSRRIERPWFERCFHPDNAPLFFLGRRLELLRRAPGPVGPSVRGHVEGDTIYLDTAQGHYHATRRELIAALPDIAPGLWDPARQRPALEAGEYLEIEREIARQVCVATSAGWACFFPALERLLAAAGTRPVAVLLIPGAFQVSDELWAQVSLGEPGFDRELPQRSITEFLRARSVPCLDVLPALRAAAARGERTYLIQDAHLDRVGNAIVGQELAAFLQTPR